MYQIRNGKIEDYNGIDFNESNLALTDLGNITVPDPRRLPVAPGETAPTMTQNFSNGRDQKVIAGGAEAILNLTDTDFLNVRFRYSQIDGQYSFVAPQDIRTLNEQWQANTAGVVTGSLFQGFLQAGLPQDQALALATQNTGNVPVDWRFLDGTQVPGNYGTTYGLLTAPFYHEYTINNTFVDANYSKQLDKVRLSGGVYGAFMNAPKIFQNVHALLNTVEENPRWIVPQLNLSAVNPAFPNLAWNQITGNNYFWQGISYFNTTDAKATALAAYAELETSFNNLTISAGARFDYLDFEGTRPTYVVVPLSPGFGSEPRISVGDTFNEPSLSLGLNYKLSNKTALFARASRGFIYPDMNTYFPTSFTQNNPSLDISNIVYQYEGGVKYGANNLAVNLTLLYARIDDLTTLRRIFQGANSFDVYFTNRSETYSVEL